MIKGYDVSEKGCFSKKMPKPQQRRIWGGAKGHCPLGQILKGAKSGQCSLGISNIALKYE